MGLSNADVLMYLTEVKCSGRGPPGQNGCNKCLQLGLRCAFDPVKRGRPIGRQSVTMRFTVALSAMRTGSDFILIQN